MPSADSLRVGYVAKRYPRYSETFIVTEILAHEAAGMPVEIFSLYPCIDSHFQDCLSRVTAPVRHLHAENLKATEFWSAAEEAAKELPGVMSKLDAARGEEAKVVYQALRLATAAKRNGINHLHAHFATSAAAVARLAAKFSGLSYTITAHAKDIFHEEVDPTDLRRKLRDAAGVITVSDFNVRYLKEMFRTDADRVQRVYNGLDLRRFEFESPEKRKPLILGVGRLVEKKGFSDLVDACAELVRKGVQFECKIVGDGERGHDLREQIKRLDVRNQVELLGPLPQREVFTLMRQAALFSAPCIVGKDQNRDGLPTVLLEAMALGTPCVSTDVTGIPEVIRDNDTGLLVPQSNATTLATAMRRLLEDGALRGRLARNARTLIEKDFDITANAAQIRELFAKAVKQQGGR